MKHCILAALALAACAAFAKDAEIMDIRPSAEAGKGAPAAEVWQVKNKAALEAAVKPCALKAIAADPAQADRLCAAVQSAYFTDALKAFQLAAVTQAVMAPGADAKLRRNWVCALVKAGKAGKDASVKQFFLDQLRWCACAKCIPALYEIAGSDKQLKLFADMIAADLKDAK